MSNKHSIGIKIIKVNFKSYFLEVKTTNQSYHQKLNCTFENIFNEIIIFDMTGLHEISMMIYYTLLI